MPSHYAANPHYVDWEANDRQAARAHFMRCEEEAGEWFAKLTVAQSTVFQMTMTDLRGLSAPRYDRAREEARAEFARTTKDAADLYDAVLQELVQTGEISEALSYRFDELLVGNVMQEAA